MLKRIAIVLVLFASPPALAGQAPISADHQSLSTALLDAAANAACDANIHNVATPACASFKIPMLGWTEATLLLLVTKTTGTSLQVYTDGGVDLDNDGDHDASDLPWGTMAAGDGSTVPKITMGDQSLEWDITGLGGGDTKAWTVTFEKLNADWVRWRFVIAGGGASDRVKVWLVRRGR